MNRPLMGIREFEYWEAAREWGCNCGPGAIAGVLGLTLEQVRPHLGDFETKHYTNPNLMYSTLRSLGEAYLLGSWRKRRDTGIWPNYGLARIQWEGPWTEPGRGKAARQRHTHWIGVHVQPDDSITIFDINAVTHVGGWVDFPTWRDKLVPWLLDVCEPEANGYWHLTHAIEVCPWRVDSPLQPAK